MNYSWRTYKLSNMELNQLIDAAMEFEVGFVNPAIIALLYATPS